MTKIEKKIAILEDAIQQIIDGFFAVNQGRVAVFFNYTYDWQQYSEQEFQNFLLKDNKQCLVCAKGALLVSAIRKFDSCSARSFLDLTTPSFCTTKNVLTKLFGQKTLDRMEVLFEGVIYPWTHKTYQNSPEGEALLKRHETLPGVLDKRLIAIFKAEIATEKAKLALKKA